MRQTSIAKMEINTKLLFFLTFVLKNFNFKVLAECNRSIDITNQKRLGDYLSLTCESKNDFVYWEHHGGWDKTLWRTYSSPNITLSNISYLDIGVYYCISKENSCVKRKVSLNVQGTPTVLRSAWHSDEGNTTFTFDIISYPPPDKNVTVRKCGTKNKGRVLKAVFFLTIFTFSLHTSNYQVNGYQMNVSLDLNTVTQNSFPCIEVYLLNEYGNISIPFNIKTDSNDSENSGTFLRFLHKNVLKITFGGIAVLMLVILTVVVVLCRMLRKVQKERVIGATKPGTSKGTLSSHTYKAMNPSKYSSLWRDPELCQTRLCPLQTFEMSEDMLPEQHLRDDTPVSENSGTYSFRHSESESFEEYDDVL